MDLHKVYSNTLIKIKNLAKKLYYYRKLNEYRNNPPKTWEILRTLLLSKNSLITVNNSPNLITVNNSPISDLNEIAE